jgi:hypothetical protein
VDVSLEQRFYDAAARRTSVAAGLIDVATRFLVEGLDSPALRELAGAPHSTRSKDLRRLLWTSLAELSIPRPTRDSPGQRVTQDGTTYARLPTDELRFEIVPARELERSYEVLIYVNGVEITEAGAGMGMHPFDLIVPANQLAATAEPRRVVVARCTCGEPGCGSTEAEITRDGDAVHWDWYVDVPLNHGVSFEATAYDAAIEQLAADRSWQQPVDTASRLVLEDVDRDVLGSAGLELSWAAADHRDPDKFHLALYAPADTFQVFLRFQLPGLSQEDVAAEVVRTLRARPPRWSASFHWMVVGRRGRPSMAGWRWRSEDAWH